MNPSPDKLLHLASGGDDDDPPPRGTRRWLISCDESGTGGAPYYGFGSLWMPYQRRGDFQREMRLVADAHGYRSSAR